ncbi:MAG: bifunctional UDP-N-acetylglucosamine diphosphorylase/glucosamine-1-phosphate N-acetyltransferase GlmU [Eubacteriales bacterium]|nr:bifunctional UDP-N-acetylglucosamine diphosphorylase/glucosamine-1-phosphate N-acetyltransferase GlmU [Eubacteriales bacterium]
MGKIASVVLAAGKGTRMKSEIPKVLFPVAGKPMLQHIINVLVEAGIEDIYAVIGYGAEKVQAAISGPITWVEQKEQLGTGHALAQAAKNLRGYDGDVLVLAGDTPLLTAATLRDLIAEHARDKNAATVLSARVPQPAGYGRIVRGSNGSVIAIAEEKDADPSQKQINEINSGAYCFNWSKVEALLDRLSTNNAQGEYYLTDIFSLLVLNGEKTGAFAAADHREILGPNDRVQLAWAEKIMRLRICRRLMGQGVSILDPDTTWIDADVEVGVDTFIYPNTFIRGATKIGGNCEIGPNATIDSCQLGDGVLIRYAVMEEATVDDGTAVGPFAYLRPGAKIGRQVKIGDFVEIKNSQIGQGSKVPHLAYVGDAQVGSNSNIGCGVITANYDGAKKSKTEIGDGVFIGSNTNLVAPVKVEDGAYVAAGSTITEDVPARALAIARARQTNKADWRKKD